jgi:SAM-dependent methyltransferase
MNATTRFFVTRRSEIHSARPWSQFRYVNRELTRMVQALLAECTWSAEASLLDYGCADRPYRNEVPAGVRYLGADLPGNADADVIINPDGSVPLGDCSCDVVLSTQVLEHVESPDTYLAEVFRMLKPGGSLLLSTHGIMYYHRDPEDYWRWTSAGLARLMQKHGFVVARQWGVLGLSAAALQLFQDANYWRVPKLLRAAFALVMQRLIARADRRQTKQMRIDNGLVIAVRAVRPVSAAAGAGSS